MHPFSADLDPEFNLFNHCMSKLETRVVLPLQHALPWSLARARG